MYRYIQMFKKMNLCTILLAIVLIHKMVVVSADQPYIRYNSGCQLLMNETRIYCYSGGYAKTVNLDITALPDHYYLDISKDLVISNSYNSWTRVSDPTNFVTEATFGYVSIKLSDTSVLINGGTGINNGKTFMNNQTTIYHADTNQWETIQNSSSFPQSYYGSGALVQNTTIVFWGGAAAIGELIPTYTGVAKLLIDQQTSKWNIEASSVAPGNPRYGHTATVDKSGKLIYYFGGRDIIRDPVTGAYTRPYSTFSNVLVYHTDTATWESKLAASTIVPSNRMSHTANLIPDTDIIVIYGGAGPDSIGNRIPVKDYIYTYNTMTNVIQPISIATSPLGSGARFGHSAIIKNKSLFIIFGIDTTLLATSDFHVLDLESYTWQTNYHAAGSISSTTNTTLTNSTIPSVSSNNTSHENNDSSSSVTDNKGLSHGAIGGICAGVFGLIFIILAFLIMRYRKKQKEKAALEEFPPYWDVTSINKNHKGIEVPVTSTGPVDITVLPGYKASTTEITNEKDGNPTIKSQQQQVLLSPVQSSSVDTYVTEHETNPVFPPDVNIGKLVTPSVPTEFAKPDTATKK